MANSISYSMADLYPGMSFESTRTLSTPDEGEQEILSDGEDITTQVHTSPVTGKHIWISIVVFLVIIGIFAAGH